VRPVGLSRISVDADADHDDLLSGIEERGVLITVRLHLDRSAFCSCLWEKGEDDDLAAEIREANRFLQHAEARRARKGEIRSRLSDVGSGRRAAGVRWCRWLVRGGLGRGERRRDEGQDNAASREANQVEAPMR
jgi:hypothetical protein